MSSPVDGPLILARQDDSLLPGLLQYRALFQDAPDGWLLTGTIRGAFDLQFAHGLCMDCQRQF